MAVLDGNFSRRSINDMFNFVKYDIDDDRAEFTRSLAWRGCCLHQNLEEGFQRLENSQNHVSEESIACRLKTTDLDTALELAFFR